jgi:hypothetical protein
MPLPLLTPTGLADKLDELYLLTDPELQIEAQAIRADFRPWMNLNFDLTPGQVNNLDNLPDDFVHALACNASSAVAFRLPITLSILNPVSVSKMIRTEPALAFSFDPVTSTYVVTGSLNIIFEYL